MRGEDNPEDLENIMNNRILITYASRTGTTAGTAEVIRTSLEEGGADVEMLPVQAVKDLGSYQAVVAGSAIRAARWLPEAMQFMRAHQSTLRHKPFAMFSVCITLAMQNGELYRNAVLEWTAPVRSIVPPLSEGLFPGMLDFSKLPLSWETLKLRATVAMGVFPRGDHRDWNAVRAWSESLKPMLLDRVGV